MIKYSDIILFCLFSVELSSQTQSWKELCPLDPRMIHSSGLLTLNNGQSFWTQVDNSSPSEIYEIDTQCRVLRTLVIANVSKTDWEDIAADRSGNIYIGDFGNNNNNRTNLKIYILRNIANHPADTITAELINFRYANQLNFPPAAPFRNFDMEAMIWHRDSLHLFSKNRTDPFTGYTFQYSLPAVAGDYNITPVDSFKCGDGPMVFYWITGAAYNEESNQLALLSHDRIWMFSNFQNNEFFRGDAKMITLPSYTQKEGICYASDNRWYLTDEYFSTLGLGGNLYEMKLQLSNNANPEDEFQFEVFPNPVSQFLEILSPSISDDKEITIYDSMGRICLRVTINKMKDMLAIQNLVNGIYYLKAHSKKWKSVISRKIVVVK